MYRRVFTNETVSNVISKDVNVFNATKLSLMAKVSFTTQTNSVFLLIQTVSLQSDFAATYKTYELKPTFSAK